MYLIRSCVLFSVLCLTNMAYADDDDTRFIMDNTQRLLNQESNWQNYRQTNDLIITINGQDYQVEETLVDLEPAIYYAINQQQWDKVALFLEKYQQLEHYQEKIIAMAQGLMARAKGNYIQAIDHLEHAYQADKQDIRSQLELARVLFEDKQYKEAKQYFNQVVQQTLPEDTQKIVKDFVATIDKQQGWHGSLALGVGHNSNINQQNGERFCYLGGGKLCDFFAVKTPDPISSRLINYELSFSKKFALKNNHNIIVKPLSYGTLYQQKDRSNPNLGNYTNNTSMLYLGYNYASIRSEFNITPFMEYFYRDKHTNYTTQGMQIDASYYLLPKWQIGGQLTAKRYHYKEREKILNSDYSLYNMGINTSYSVSNSFQVYSGLDYVRRKYKNDVASSHEYGARVGVFKIFEKSGIYINSMAIFRQTQYGAYDYILNATRKDNQRIYLAYLGASKWAIKGIYPELRLKRVVNRSNVGPVQFSQNEVTINLRKNF